MPYAAADVLRREKILQVLLVAPPKAGKTSVAVLTAPKPVFVFNTDGPGALDYVATSPKADFEAEDVHSRADFDRGWTYLKANHDKFQTVVFDNITFFNEMLIREVTKEVGRDDPRVIYPKVTSYCVEMVRSLLRTKLHTIIVGQTDPGDSNIAGAFGHMVSVSGKSKILLPALMQDLLWLETSIKDEHVRREFLLAPSGNWTKGSRSVSGIPRVKADFTEFLRLAREGVEAKEEKPTAKTKTKTNGWKPSGTVTARTSTAKPNTANS